VPCASVSALGKRASRKHNSRYFRTLFRKIFRDFPSEEGSAHVCLIALLSIASAFNCSIGHVSLLHTKCTSVFILQLQFINFLNWNLFIFLSCNSSNSWSEIHSILWLKLI
jgi:hypothetical protein